MSSLPRIRELLSQGKDAECLWKLLARLRAEAAGLRRRWCPERSLTRPPPSDMKAGLEGERAALLIAIAGLADGRKEVVAVVPGFRESIASWSEVLRDLRERGMGAPRLVVGDGHLGIWGALGSVFPEADEQRCWNHKVLNVLEQLPRRQQGVARALLRAIAYAPSRAEAEGRRREFEAWCREHGYAGAAATLGRHWERMVTFYRYPREHWRHIRTTNVVELPFAALRLRVDAAKRFKRVDRATAVIWKMLMVAQQRFRRLNAPELLARVYAGVNYQDGIEVAEEEAAA